MTSILAIIMFGLMMLIGGERGSKSFVTLCGNVGLICLMVFFMYIGISPILVTVIGGGLIAALTLFFQNDNNIKTQVAFIAVVIVIIVFFGFAFLIVYQTNGGSFNELDTVEEKLYYSSDIDMNMMNIAVSVIIIGLLGAVIDSAMAIATGVYEVYENNKHLDEKELFKSGINIGKDIIGTTMNTLAFAYLGESLMLYILVQTLGYSFATLINSSTFFQEFISILFSGLGCIVIIPLTALLMSRALIRPLDIKIFKKKNKDMR